jgi:hypothetical protein
MAVDAKDLQYAAFLADAAYQLSSSSLDSYLNGSLWRRVGDLFSFDSPGFPAGQTGAGFIALSTDGRTLALSFRGSDRPWADDYYNAVYDQLNYYTHFAPLIAQLRACLSSNSPEFNQVTRVLVTGHSLGGAMAEIYVSRDAFAVDNPTLITFGSPGVNDNARDLDVTAIASHVLHVGHTGDPMLGRGGTLQGPFVRIELPDVSDGPLNQRAPSSIAIYTTEGVRSVTRGRMPVENRQYFRVGVRDHRCL